jgi:hypothetical protein
VLIAAIDGRADSSEVRLALLPALLLVVSAIGLVVYELSRLQPVNLIPWLERDRANGAQTVLLYRRINEALEFCSARVARGERAAARFSHGWDLLRTILLTTGVALLALVVALVAEDTSALENDQSKAVAGLGLAVLVIGLIFKVGRQAPRTSFGLMSLVAEYRDFASTVVYRLRSGALGESSPSARVVVCVDELDKIVELDEMRAFLRRIKAIFEVPGVYYYLSLAEDALQQLYLGGAAGKTEVDSSLDHIVVVEPLSIDESASIARKYLTTKNVTRYHARIPELIAALSFGVSRDVLRRCDELIANPESLDCPLADYVAEVRARAAEVAHNGGLLSKEQYEAVLLPVPSVLQTCARMLEDVRQGRRSASLSAEGHRVLLQIWAMALVEIAVVKDSEEQWSRWSRAIGELGYLIPVRPSSEVQDMLAELTLELLPNVLPPESVPTSRTEQRADTGRPPAASEGA